MRYLPVIFALWSAAVASAADWFVSVEGSPTNNGAITNTWSLTHALTNGSSVAGNDTVWIRAGTYSGDFDLLVSGNASNSPVIFRNYANERAIIDGQLSLISSSNTWIWGLEFIDSNKTNRIAVFNTIEGSLGLGVKVINCVIHDCCIGISPPGVHEAYGNVIWNAGESSTEHAFYIQNATGIPRVMENNLIGYSSGFGIHLYSGVGSLSNLYVLGNIVYGSGAPLNDAKAEILLGGGMVVANGIIRSNHIFTYGRGIEVGYSSETNIDVTIDHNYVVSAWWGKNAVVKYNWDSLNFSNNILATRVGANVLSIPTNSGNLNWDENKYYSTATVNWWQNGFCLLGEAAISWTEWRTNGYDANSTFVNDADPTNGIYILPNKYETNRAHVVVWNWAGAASVTVDLSSVLHTNEAFVIRSGYNYLGTPVASGTYTGPVTLPTAPRSLAPKLYWDSPQVGYNASTNLAVFVVLGGVTAPPATAGTLRVQHLIIR